MIAGFRRKRHRDGRAGGVLACGRGVTRASANVDDLSAILRGPVEEKIVFGLNIGSIDGST
jgi:hypothetical protein